MNGIMITTNDRQQREQWISLFQTDTLPVLSARPYQGYDKHGRSRWYFTLDAAAMDSRQVMRLAGFVQRRRGGEVNRIAHAIYTDGFPIDATHCEILETAQTRPSLSVWKRFRGLVPRVRFAQ